MPGPDSQSPPNGERTCLDAEIAIIGGGFSGAALAINLARHQGPSAVLLHARENAGYGLAYSTTDSVHLLNVRAATMSALADDPEHFARWLDAAGLGSRESFVPRQLYGRYVAALLAETSAAGPQRLITKQAEVVGLNRKADKFEICLSSGQIARAGKVVLAMGNLPPAGISGLEGISENDDLYIADPWKTDLTDGLPSDGHVLLLGTGLTAVDVALLLTEAGFKGRITALSRRGLLPRSHVPGGAPPLLAEPPQPKVREIARHLREQSKRIGWRHAVDQLRPHTQQLWQRMDQSERRRFLRHARPWWEVHRHRTAPAVADQIAALQAGGKLCLERGRIVSSEASADGVTVKVRGADATVRTLEIDRVVNCTGPSANLQTAQDPLLISLREQGLARVDALGLGLETDHVSRVINADGQPTPDLFAVGPLTRGSFWEITAVPDIRRQVWFLARQLARAHWVGGEGL
jgi:uncharacterized NAD(P)/FAD-binding protein YdhS